MARHYICFDANMATGEGFRLQSPDDFDRLGDLLEPGLGVVLFEPWDGFEIEAELELDEVYRVWRGVNCGATRYLVPAYRIIALDLPPLVDQLRAGDHDTVLDLVQEDTHAYTPWLKMPWWLGRSTLGDVVGVLRRHGVARLEPHLVGPGGRVLLLSRAPALLLSAIIERFLKEHPQENFKQSRTLDQIYQDLIETGWHTESQAKEFLALLADTDERVQNDGIVRAPRDAGRLAAAYIRDACRLPPEYAAVAIFLGPTPTP